jgi:ribosomal protein S12 methylthiotransferase accessory factor
LPGWDLANETKVFVPAAVVATDYTLSSPYRSEPFQRTTTGLGAGPSLHHAVRHGLSEIVERHAVAEAMATHGFFDKHRLATQSIGRPVLAQLLDRVTDAGFLAGFWLCASPCGWSVVWARILEADDRPDQLPLPADGFAADCDMQVAAEKALLEAVQTRASVIAGGREDITRRAYSRFPNRDVIDAERNQLSMEDGAPFTSVRPASGEIDFGTLTDGSPLPIITVPLFNQNDPEIYVVRMIVPGMNVVAS